MQSLYILPVCDFSYGVMKEVPDATLLNSMRTHPEMLSIQGTANLANGTNCCIVLRMLIIFIRKLRMRN